MANSQGVSQRHYWDAFYQHTIGAKYEFVAISAGSTVITERVLDCPIEEYHDLSPGQLFEFYNVLRVERNNGIAYRRGIGRILKKRFGSDKLRKLLISLLDDTISKVP
jgi:hypothetical protein